MKVLRVLSVIVVTAHLSCAQPPEERGDRPFDPSDYAWLQVSENDSSLCRLDGIFEPPHGAQRISLATESFGSWLRGLPVIKERVTVKDYRGRPVPAPAAAIVDLDLGSQDLQQCADTILRLHAEYLWSSEQSSTASYHFTSGDLSRWTDWVAGVRWEPRGSGVFPAEGPARATDHASYRSWLQHLFMYAGTRSMAFDSQPVSGPIEPGDFFVDPGSPGHAVLVLDVATTADGRRLALIGQGFTPAQEFHVLTSPDAVEGVWFELPERDSEHLETPSWRPFAKTDARRFKRPADQAQ